MNTVRGSGFPEITLDDLSVQFSGYANRGRLDSSNDEGSASSRRGRSVSRRVGDGKGSGGNSYINGKANPESNSRRRRSVSVVRYQQQVSDSEVSECFLFVNFLNFIDEM